MKKEIITYRHTIYNQGFKSLLFTLVMLSSCAVFAQGYVNPNRNKTESATVRNKPFATKNLSNVKLAATTSNKALVRLTAHRNIENFRNGWNGSQPGKKQNELVVKNVMREKRNVVIAALSKSEIEKSRNTTKKSPILNDKKFQNRTIAYWRPFKTNIIYQND